MVRTILLGGLAALALTAHPARAAEACEGAAGAGKVKLTVTAEGVRNAQGEVAFTVYGDDERRFLAKGGKLARVRTPAAAPRTSACFWLSPGNYAVAIYHDENGDRDFNRTLFKVKEGFGFSNDAPATLGLPAFSKARFALPAGGTTIRIRMRYPK
ncbi:MAG TPA: DUF2141 domain-containing protein [Sphingomonas sp.]|nr:DUF2141 domain-containing protein [Sphingomonas sp.]